MLSISTTHFPATDLGYLLHKSPHRAHPVELTFGQATILFPEANDQKCTAALLLDVDPVALVRGREDQGGSLKQYVNDRPYAASSFLSSAITRVFGTALTGRCKEKPELAGMAIPLEIDLPVIRSRFGLEAFEKLFVPLGYTVEAEQIPLDELFPEWGTSPYYRLKLSALITLQSALQHLYVLLPVLDAQKHYYMDRQEVEKLLHKGGDWLAGHPAKEWIVRGYLGRKPSLMRSALEQLANIEPELDQDEAAVDEAIVAPEEEAPPKRRESLHEQRHMRAAEIIAELKPSSVIDLGCGEGRLIRKLIPIRGLNRIVGMDVSYFGLEKAERLLHLENASPKMRERVQLIHGSLMYRDERLHGFDAAAVIEVIEHLDPPRLNAFEQVVFEHARPSTVVLSTPNREYNAVYEKLDGDFRHEDHRFEWTRAEFHAWLDSIQEKYGYKSTVEPVGEDHPEYGAPSLLAVMKR